MNISQTPFSLPATFDGDVLGSWPNPASVCETEDVVVDPSDRTVWIGADTFIHGGFDNGNRVWHVDPHHTYNKDVFFPNMCHWWLGSTEEPLFLAGDEIGIRDGEVGGVWLSPVIDFQGYCPEPAVLTNLAEWTATVRYRGGEEMPTSQGVEGSDVPWAAILDHARAVRAVIDRLLPAP